MKKQPHSPSRSHVFKLCLLLLAAHLATAAGYGQGRSVKPEEDMTPVIFTEMNADLVIQALEERTGKPVLRKQNLPQVSITFDSQRPLSNDEAILVIKSLLSMNGIAITEVGDKYLKAVVATEVDTEVPTLLVQDPQSMEPSQVIFAHLFELEYLTTEEAQALLEPFKTANGRINSFPSANALLVTDALINLQRLKSLLDKLDKPAELREEVLFLPLSNVSAQELQQRLTRMRESSLKPYLQGNTSIEADERTNQLIIITHPGNRPLIEKIITNLDIDVAPLTHSEVITVSNAEAATVADLIKEIITGQEQTREKDAPNASGNQPVTTQNTTAPAQTAKANAQQALAGDNTKLQFSDYVQIVADERSNAIVAYGTDSDIQQVRDLVKKIDVLLAQVQIEVVIAEVTLSNDRVRGIESFGINATNQEIELVSLQGPSTASLASPFTVSGTLKDFSLETVFRTAKRDSSVDVLSAPTIVTTHNQEATIVVGESRPIITSTQSSVDTTNTFSSVSFENIGIELTVKPLIGANGVIQMEIEQKIEKVIDTTQIDNNEQPIIGTREASSFLSISDQDIIVLGGLQEIELNEGEGRVFLLGELPIIGSLFRSKSESRTVRELLLFIKPTIIRLPEDANNIAQREIDNVDRSSHIRENLQRWRDDTAHGVSTSFVRELPEKPEEPEESESHRGHGPKR